MKKHLSMVSKTIEIVEALVSVADLSLLSPETDTEDEPEPFRPVFRTKAPEPADIKHSTSTTHDLPARDESSSEYETDSEEEESSSSESAPPAPIFRPSFVSKSQRTTLDEQHAAAETEEALASKAKAEQAKRKQEAHDLAAAKIKAGLEEAEAAAVVENPDLSDTDGRDPEGEFQAWRERELKRLSRARQAEQDQGERDAEQERRNKMTQAELDAEDTAYANKTRQEKMASRPAVGFMQKYRHKGAFFQDMDILKRDYTGPTENEVNKAALPQIMQVRDFGRKGRSKWSHLAAEDTTRQTPLDPRFRPRQKDERPSARQETQEGTGSNAFAQQATRRWGHRQDVTDAQREEGPSSSSSHAGSHPPHSRKGSGRHGSSRLRLKDDDRPRRKAGEYDLDDGAEARPREKRAPPVSPPRKGDADERAAGGDRKRRRADYDGI